MLDLNKLATDLGFEVEDIHILLEMFIENANQSLEHIEGALQTGDLQTLSLEAHSIKGSAANLQLEEITQSAHIIEESAKQNLECDYQKIASQLKEQLQELSLICA